MDIRDVAKLTGNNIGVVQHTVNEQAGCLCLLEQAHAITATLAVNPSIEWLTECVKGMADKAVAHGFTADDMRSIAAYALAAAAWLDMDAADRGEDADKEPS